MPRYRDAPPKKTTQRLAERVSLQSQQLMERRQQKEQQKQRRKKKRNTDYNDEDDNEEDYDNEVQQRELAETINDNNEHNDYDDDDDSDDDDDDDEIPRRSLPNRTHNDLHIPSTKTNEIPNENGIDVEVENSQVAQHLVSPNLLNSSSIGLQNYDCHKYDMDLPVAKLDPFTLGAHVTKCVNETLFPICKFFRNNQDVDLFMALVFDQIGMDGFRSTDHYKRMTSWVAIRQFIRKRTNDIRQLCVDRWYITAKSK